MRTRRALRIVLASLICLAAGASQTAELKPAWQLEWDTTVEAAKNDGKLLAALPASAEVRKAITKD